MNKHYQTLEVEPNSTEETIKRAYRKLAKAFHPDTAKPGEADTAKFREVHDAYETLLDGITKGYGSRGNSHSPDPQNMPGSDNFEFRGVYHQGLDIFYVVEVDLRAVKQNFAATLPLKLEKACPKCLGVGHTFSIEGNEKQDIEKVICPRCLGRRIVEHNSQATIKITLADVLSNHKRLPGMGHYNPAEAKRGDLVIQFLNPESKSENSDVKYHA